MSLFSTIRSAALATTCLIPLALSAQAQDQPGGFDLGDAPVTAPAAVPAYDNQATIGLRYQSGNSALYGRYNDEPFKGETVTGSVLVRSGDLWNSGGTHYFSAEGTDLTVNNHNLMPGASASVKYGEQGSWGLNVYYDGIAYQQSLNFHSLDNPSGGLNVPTYSLNPLYSVNNTTLATTAQGGPPVAAPLVINNPKNFGTAAFTAVTASSGGVLAGGATAAQLSAAARAMAPTLATIDSLTPQGVGLQREKVGMMGNWSPLTDWTFSLDVNHEHKEGTKENSLVMNNKDNVTYFPEPVDYDTDRVTAMAKYYTKTLQAVLSYSYSRFTDNLGTFNTQNPWAPATTYAPGYVASSYSLPPSNDAQMVKAQLAYNLTPTTRLNANFGYSLMQTTSGDPVGFVGAMVNPYIGGDYHAQNQNLFGNVTLTARPIAKTDFRASYTYDDREDNSSRIFIPASANGATVKGVTAPYGMIAADVPSTNDVPIANLPVSVLTQTAKFDAGYAFMPSTKLSLNYTYIDKQRDFSVTDHNHENSASARVNSSLADDLTGSIGLTHAVRTADSYFASGAWNASTFGDANNPGLGMFYLAARTRDEIKGRLNWGPSDTVSTGLTARFDNDNYPNSFFGVTNDHKLSIGPDIAYTPNKVVAFQLFYTFEELYTGQNFTTTNSPVAAQTDWTLGNKDSIQTLGIKADWQASEKIKVTIDDNFSYGATTFAEGYALLASSTGAAQIASPTNIATALPDSKTITNSLRLSGEYKLTDSLTLIGTYGFERAIAKDYLYDQPAGLNTSAGVASLPGDGNPSYSIQLVSMSVRMRW